MYGVSVDYQREEYDQTWAYLVDDSIVLVLGDKVVVPVLGADIFRVGTVVNVNENPKLRNDIFYRWVVQRIDLETYNKCLGRSNAEGGIKDYNEEIKNGQTNYTAE